MFTLVINDIVQDQAGLDLVSEVDCERVSD